MEKKKSIASLYNFRFIVTAGATREWIDPVRFLSNPATGKTGWHIASQASQIFKEVIYIYSSVSDKYQKVDKAKNIFVESTADMCEAVHKYLQDNCILVMTAAPADYSIKNYQDQKIKKQNLNKLSLELTPTVDILKSIIPVAPQFQNLYCIGFAAETHNIHEYAKKKLKEKELFLICANQVYKNKKGFGKDKNELFVIDKKLQEYKLGPNAKSIIAKELLALISSKIQKLNSPIKS